MHEVKIKMFFSILKVPKYNTPDSIAQDKMLSSFIAVTAAQFKN